MQSLQTSTRTNQTLTPFAKISNLISLKHLLQLFLFIIIKEVKLINYNNVKINFDVNDGLKIILTFQRQMM